MQILAVMNEKGGCGRTTVAINLAAAAARLGHRVLVLDLDGQNHAAIGLGAPLDRVAGSAAAIAKCLTAADQNEAPARLSRRIEDAVWPAAEHLNLLPLAPAVISTERRGAGIFGTSRPGGDRSIAVGGRRVEAAESGDEGFRIGRALARMLESLEEEYDWCVIDTPAGRGPWTEAAGRVASDVIVPVDPSMFGLMRLESMLDWIQSIGPRGSRYRRPLHLLASAIAPGRRFTEQIMQEISRRYPDAVMPIQLVQDPLLCEAAGFGRPVINLAPESETAATFRRMVRLCRRPRRLRTRAVAAISAARRGELPLDTEMPIAFTLPGVDPIAHLLRAETEQASRLCAAASAGATGGMHFGPNRADATADDSHPGRAHLPLSAGGGRYFFADHEAVSAGGLTGPRTDTNAAATPLRGGSSNESEPGRTLQPLMAAAGDLVGGSGECQRVEPGAQQTAAFDARGAGPSNGRHDAVRSSNGERPAGPQMNSGDPGAAAPTDTEGPTAASAPAQSSQRILELVERTRRMTHSTGRVAPRSTRGGQERGDAERDASRTRRSHAGAEPVPA